MFSQGSDVGNRSSSQVFFAVFLRMLCTSFSDAGVNCTRSFDVAGTAVVT